jgi:cation diffusion facilitator CzcD-associated flavoprotein CzcO
MLYSFSFEPSTEWTRVYPSQTEIWEYARTCVDKYGLRSSIRFNAALVDAVFDDSDGTWTVRTSDGGSLRCRVLIAATGPLNTATVPEIPGIGRFRGTVFHSAKWDASFDPRGKRVAVVGTGASAIQLVPQVAPLAERLTVFQRTAPWIIPRGDHPISARRRSLRRSVPFYAWFERKRIYWTLEVRALGLAVNPKLAPAVEAIARRHLERQVSDPELRRKLTPNFVLGCKRVLLSSDYYPAFSRPNVELVTEPVVELTEDTVVTKDGRAFPVDAVVFGTGFRPNGALTSLDIRGRGGVALQNAWRDGQQAYLGTSVAGFPNFFTLIGPNTGLGHNSMILMMEAQFAYVLHALELLRRKHARAIDVKPNVQAEFNRRLQRRMKGTVWSTGCTSWYLDENGVNRAIWPGFTFTYRWLTRRIVPSRYEFVT